MATVFSSADLQHFRDVAANDPVVGKFNEMLVAYAERKGGLVLTFWKTFMGPLWGEPKALTFDECVDALGVPRSTLLKLAEESDNAVRTSSEFRAFRAQHE